MTGDPAWFNNFDVLFDTTKITEFMVHKNMTFTEKLNAVFRFSIYAAVLLYAYHGNWKVFLFPLFVSALTIYLGKTSMDPEYSPENKENMKPTCQLPSENNPYANVLVTDISENPDKLPACNPENPEIQAMTQKYMGTGHDYDNSLSRIFNTQPVTTVTQESYDDFVKWTHSNPNPTCREDTRFCKIWGDDVRYQRSAVVV
jgi:hypothetical protein